MKSFIEFREDMQKKYGKGLAKSTNQKRQAQFNKQAKMDDDDPEAYKPAPGDKEAETKPSKHTKKFKQMYGESMNTVHKWRWTEKANDAWVAEFKSHNKVVKVSIETPKANEAVVSFDRNDRVSLDGDGDAMGVFGTVIDVVKEYVKTQKPAKLKFEAYYGGKKKRASVYEKMLKRNLDAGYAYKVNAGKISSSFTVYKKDDIKEETLEENKAVKNKAEKSGMPYGVLKQVYNRGVAAWKTGHRPGTTPEQWGLARVNSFTTKSKGTWGGADKDLAAKVRG